MIDHQFCVENDYTLLLEGKRNRIPLLLGNTEDEFCAVPSVKSREELAGLAKEMFGADAEEYMRLCPRDGEAFAEALERVRVNGIEYTIRLLAQRDKDLKREGPMYYYRFAAEIPGWDHPGTFHSVDLWFFFETLAKCWRPFIGKHYDLSRQMCNYWANFIRSGDPNGRDANGDKMPEWKPYTADQPYGMLFADQAEGFREEPQGAMALLLKAYKGI